MKRNVPFAKVGRPHGTRGEVRLWLFNPETDILRAGLELDTTVDGTPRTLTIHSVRFSDRFAIVAFKGVRDREDVVALTHAVLHVSRDEFDDDLDDGEFFQADLLGLDVWVRTDDGKEKIGRVKGFMESTQDVDLIAVTGKRIAGRLLVLMTEEIVESISLEEGITIAPLDEWAPEGTTLKEV